jgi:UDP-N-acetylmuramyl pentapeptide synthase
MPQNDECNELITIEDVARAVEGRLSGGVAAPDAIVVSDVTHDSREARTGSLFVAIEARS